MLRQALTDVFMQALIRALITLGPPVGMRPADLFLLSTAPSVGSVRFQPGSKSALGRRTEKKDYAACSISWRKANWW
jgi:hypothetical protein